jgi:uncharacterized membrane protein required for colicin V production
MNLQSISVSWVDFVVVMVLGFGIWRGRKRGMSEELVDIVKWVVTVIAATLLYRPLSVILQQSTSFFSPLAGSVIAYLSVVAIVAVAFFYIRKGTEEKLTGSDSFGSGEYYLGMLSGMARYACVLIVVFAFLHARQYSAAEVKASQKYQLDNFGSSFFLTIPDLQRAVFTESIFGRSVKEFIGFVLIVPVSPGAPDAPARAREKYL